MVSNIYHHTKFQDCALKGASEVVEVGTNIHGHDDTRSLSFPFKERKMAKV
jgi:hypothetical protein